MSSVKSITYSSFWNFFYLSIDPWHYHNFSIQWSLILCNYNWVKLCSFQPKFLNSLILFVIKFSFINSSVCSSATEPSVVFCSTNLFDFSRMTFELKLSLIYFSGIGWNYLNTMHATGCEKMSSVGENYISDMLHCKFFVNCYFIFQDI